MKKTFSVIIMLGIAIMTLVGCGGGNTKTNSGHVSSTDTLPDLSMSHLCQMLQNDTARDIQKMSDTLETVDSMSTASKQKFFADYKTLITTSIKSMKSCVDYEGGQKFLDSLYAIQDQLNKVS